VRGEDDIGPREEKLRSAENERFYSSRGTQINCEVSDDDGVNQASRPSLENYNQCGNPGSVCAHSLCPGV
jgi:hypothetical protein